MYRYWYGEIEGIDSKRKRSLAEYLGEETVYQMSSSRLEKTGILTKTEYERIEQAKKEKNPRETKEQAENKGIHLVTVTQAEYPARLRHYADAPYGLYYKGKLPPENKKTVGIVGARMCTPYGKSCAESIAEFLAQQGVMVISGMARGIDAFAHKGAIKAGKETYAVLGNGADICYPVENRQLYERIEEMGGILSEYPPKVQPKPWYFPARNRIISGLSDALIIIEAKEKSGSLITADLALEQGKDVLAVPGRMTDPLSVGCNRLIRQGAQAVTSLNELLTDLGIEQREEMNFKHKINFTLEKTESLVYSCLGLAPKSIDRLLSESGLALSELINILERLKAAGLAEEYFKNSYIRKV